MEAHEGEGEREGEGGKGKKMAAFGGAAGNTGTAMQQHQDIEVSSPPADGVSSISFSPNSNLLAGTSWGAEKNLLCVCVCVYMCV